MNYNPNIKVFDLDSDECIHESNVKDLNNKGYFKYAGNCVYMAEKYLGCAKVNKLLINNLKIPNGFKEIKSIKRKLKITQCKIVASNLFLEGCILENITYVCKKDKEKECSNVQENNWFDISSRIPFSTVCYLGKCGRVKQSENVQKDYAIYCDTINDSCCDSGFMGESECERLSEQFTKLNGFPYGKLNSYSITDLRISRKRRGDKSCKFEVLCEKISLNLFIDIFIKDKFIVESNIRCEKLDECRCGNDLDECYDNCFLNENSDSIFEDNGSKNSLRYNDAEKIFISPTDIDDN